MTMLPTVRSAGVCSAHRVTHRVNEKERLIQREREGESNELVHI